MNGAFNRQTVNKRFRHFHEPLAEAIVNLSRGKTVSDFGAGIGLYAAYVRAYGLHAVGYDGTPGIAEQTNGLVETVDLSVRCDLPMTQVVMSIEVGEHIPPECHEVFIGNLCRHSTELIILSWAVPGQRGRGHINCRSPESLIEDIEPNGFRLDFMLTSTIRQGVGKPFDKKLLVFRKGVGGYTSQGMIQSLGIAKYRSIT